jgi:hypothetical protein
VYPSEQCSQGVKGGTVLELDAVRGECVSDEDGEEGVQVTCTVAKEETREEGATKGVLKEKGEAVSQGAMEEETGQG